ncbi:GPW/gp25 family protein [Wandonia haliotis]|uniref:GPW/gp25 family protein n=1 Tax=Wandonia haliotis TaxID=574963 RepID=A0ABN1MRC8_9FLAO
MTDFIDTKKAFLGRGWGFPVTFSKTAKQVVMTEAEENIRSSIEIVLQTTLGERVMQPEFGANLTNYVFDSMDSNFRTFVTEQIRVAIIKNEPRAQLAKVEYNERPLEGRIDIIVYYTVLSTNSRYNIVYPFYLKEGTDIEG